MEYIMEIDDQDYHYNNDYNNDNNESYNNKINYEYNKTFVSGMNKKSLPLHSGFNDIVTIVNNLKLKESEKNRQMLVELIQEEPDLTNKCIYCREYLPAQSTDMETIMKKDLRIGPPINATSGDGCKNNIHYEIKYSGHSKMSQLNFVQIRPDHNVDYYIFVGYNMYDDMVKGKAYIFKIPSHIVYDLVVKFGGYAHGTVGQLGKITYDNLKGRHCEYALRCNPNVKKGKNKLLWDELLKYETEYHHECF